MACTVFIDESGDTGFTKIRNNSAGGSSPYMAMSAVVLQPASQIAARQLLDELQEEFGKTKKWRHATDLNHNQRVYFCKKASELNVRFFGVISYKPTMREYASKIEWSPHKFYNKCAKYLLELVGRYLANVDESLTEPRIVFEERNHDYDAMIRYIAKVKDNPIYPQSNSLAAINPFSITRKNKDEEDLLRLADLVSHALYSCVNKTPDNFGIVETRYLRELSSKFAADSSGRVLGSGIKCIHKLEELSLDDETNEFLKKMRAMPPPRKRH
ncbi:DUF3800 domain-containing protein [Octadecabacter sp. SW4]|uniref:DUF3800 domain-containing protein n=1 Tax=Octadecabacter sp. SW4 TaxID=2602067 RepID=UPI0011C1E1BA|nr:DUF3800 domain-containing protein [Octadecabacter sp. SW4]QEE35063.1 DUF3800 domain-containing protein [Octadecabacter sp. SW4]